MHKLFNKIILFIVASLCFAFNTYAGCTGSTNTSTFTPAVVSINKNTGVGQVVSSATVTVSINCNSTYVAGNQWFLNYTPQSPLVTTSLSQQTFATSMPGLGFRMYDWNGRAIAPTSYGTNGGDNFGSTGIGGGNSVPATYSGSFTFKIDLVRTDTSLTSGTFNSSLVRFGYQYGGSASGCDANISNGGGCTYQFGSEVTSPVNFQFINPACTVAGTSVNKAVPLPDVYASSFTGIGTKLGNTGFNIDLINCVLSSGVTMTIAGTTDTGNTVLKNTGAAQGVGVQLTSSLIGTSPIVFNNSYSMGNVGSNTSFSIPFVANYYQTQAAVSSGSVNALSTLTFAYN